MIFIKNSSDNRKFGEDDNDNHLLYVALVGCLTHADYMLVLSIFS